MDVENELTSLYKNLLKENKPNKLQAMEKKVTHILIFVTKDQNVA